MPNALTIYPEYRRRPNALLTAPDGVIKQGSWLDFNPTANALVSGLAEILGIAPSERVMQRAREWQSPVLRPQPGETRNLIGMRVPAWADEAAGMASDLGQTALSAADLAGVAGAASPFARKMMQSQRGSIGDVDTPGNALVNSTSKTGGGEMATNQGSKGGAVNKFRVYHGTDATNFSDDVLKIEHGSKNVPQKNAQAAIWFTSDGTEASWFANQAAGVEATRLHNKGDHDAGYKKVAFGSERYGLNYPGGPNYLGYRPREDKIYSGEAVIPLDLELKNPKVVEWKGKGINVDKAVEQAIKRGHDGIIIKNIYNPESKITSDYYGVFKDVNISNRTTTPGEPGNALTRPADKPPRVGGTRK